MPLKRPVTLPQARRWPAAAKRRQSFCARMGGMRERLTGERAARDPASPINRALAAWDCDEPELLRAEHVSKGIRMKITKGKVGSEAKPARKNPAKKMTARYQILRWIQGTGIKAVSKNRTVSLSKDEWMEVFDNWEQALDFLVKAKDDRQIYGKPWPWETQKNPAPAKRIKTRRIVRVDPKTGQAIGTEFVPIDFDFRAYIGGIQYDFFARTEGAQLIISERTTGAKVGAVPFTTRSAALNDREAAKLYLSSVIERVGADKFKAAIEKAPKVSP